MYTRASVECTRVGVCVTELGVGIYSTPSSSPASLALWGGCGGRSQQIYAPLGAEAAFAE